LGQGHRQVDELTTQEVRKEAGPWWKSWKRGGGWGGGSARGGCGRWEIGKGVKKKERRVSGQREGGIIISHPIKVSRLEGNQFTESNGAKHVGNPRWGVGKIHLENHMYNRGERPIGQSKRNRFWGVSTNTRPERRGGGG